MKASEILTRAKALILKPSRRIVFDMARNGMGRQVEPEDPSAVCWCSVGALRAAARNSGSVYIPARMHLERAAKEINPQVCGPMDFNDTHTHSAVMEMFDRAIEMAVKEESNAQS